MSKLTGFIAGAALTFGVGVASAGEAPEILGAADYQAMSSSQMSSITGENRRIKIVNRNNNVNVNQQQQAQCAAVCAGGDVNVASAALPGLIDLVGGVIGGLPL
jgi:hypothetical protein